MDRSQLASSFIDTQDATQIDPTYPFLPISFNENLHDSQYSITQRADRIKRMIKDMSKTGIDASQLFCDTQFDSTQPDRTQHNFTQPDITQHPTLANYSSERSIKCKLKNIPGHIMLAIQKGCRYYFNAARRCKVKEGGRSGQLNLSCISHVLRRQEQYVQEKFEKFIEDYDTCFMTWTTIFNYIKQYNDKDLVKVLQEMVEELFANENKADLENWLGKSKMAAEMKDEIRANKAKLQVDFMDRLDRVEFKRSLN